MPMSDRRKCILAGELILCFGPIALFGLWGTLAVPISLVETVSGSENYIRFLVSMALGLLGLIGRFYLARVVIFEAVTRLPLKLVLFFVACGIVAAFTGLGPSLGTTLTLELVVLPVLCALHFSWLGLQHLTSKAVGVILPRKSRHLTPT